MAEKQTSETSAGHSSVVAVREPREVLETRALANLRQAFWEASQFKAPAELVAYCDQVASEIERDEP